MNKLGAMLHWIESQRKLKVLGPGTGIESAPPKALTEVELALS